MKIANAIAATYVLENVQIDESLETKIEISARRAGLISWILAKLFKRIIGMTFFVREDGVVLNDGWHQWIPMAKISNVGCGYVMNTLWQVLGILALVVGIVTIKSIGFGLLVLAAIFFYLYSRSRRFMISITACSGDDIRFAIKRGVIGGKSLTEEDAERIIEIIKKLVIAK